MIRATPPTPPPTLVPPPPRRRVLVLRGDECWIHICGIFDVSSEESFINNDNNYCYWELYIDLILIAAAVSIPNVLIWKTTIPPTITTTTDNNDASSSSLFFFQNRQETNQFIEFSLFYFCIMNGWYLYSHHYSSRFIETSRFQSILVCCFIVGMILSIYNIPNNYYYYYYDDDDDDEVFDYANDNDNEVVMNFSISMIIQRISIFLMIGRVAIYIPQANAFCSVLGLFVADSILCFTIACADTDNESISYFLWGISICTELLLDFLLLLLTFDTTTTNGNNRNNNTYYISFNLQKSMDRLWILILAPIGAIIITIVTTTTVSSTSSSSTTTSSSQSNYLLMICASIILHILFAMLYLDLQPLACHHVVTYHASNFLKAMLLTVVKLLGWSLWTVEACLLLLLKATVVAAAVVEGPPQPSPLGTTTGGQQQQQQQHHMITITEEMIDYAHLLLGWSVGFTLILFLALKLFGRRRRFQQGGPPLEVLIWIVACSIPFLVVYVIPSSQSMYAICIYLVMVSLLNVLESWRNYMMTTTTTISSNNNLNTHNNSPTIIEQEPTNNNTTTLPSETDRLLPMRTTMMTTTTTLDTTTVTDSPTV